MRGRIRRKLARQAARIEEDIAAHEAEREHMHDVEEEGDIDMLKLLTIDQQSKYDVYADSQGQASTRPLEE